MTKSEYYTIVIHFKNNKSLNIVKFCWFRIMHILTLIIFCTLNTYNQFYRGTSLDIYNIILWKWNKKHYRRYQIEKQWNTYNFIALNKWVEMYKWIYDAISIVVPIIILIYEKQFFFFILMLRLRTMDNDLLNTYNKWCKKPLCYTNSEN